MKNGCFLDFLGYVGIISIYIKMFGCVTVICYTNYPWATISI